jgi:hypothetical protein
MPFLPTRWVLVLCLTGSALVAPDQWHAGFDTDTVDQPPEGFTMAAMRQVDPGRWLVRRLDDNGYLAHQPPPRADASGYSLAIADMPMSDDLALSVRMRAASAARGGGLVWRYRDDRNFYALLLDLTRGELAVYRITSGNRVRLDVEDGLELDPLAWHTLKVIHVDSTLRVMLGGIRVFHEQDRRYCSSSRTNPICAEVWRAR